MQQHFSAIYRLFSSLHQSLVVFYNICHLIERHTDLAQLEDWARRKQLYRPRQYYQTLLMDTDSKLLMYRKQALFLVLLATIAMDIYLQINPVETRQHFRGYGKKYRGVSHFHTASSSRRKSKMYLHI